MIVHVPRDLPEALGLLASLPGAIPAGGTTDLLPRWHAGARRPDHVVMLGGIADLGRIAVEDGALVVGALATHRDLASSAAVREHAPALARAALSVGAPAVRNTGTVGGNIANASPAADLPPVLLAHDASLVVSSVCSEREVALCDFFLSYASVDLQPAEIITSVRVPSAARWTHWTFDKLGTRNAQSIAKVSVAGACRLSRGRVVESVRLAAGSVAEIPLRLRRAEAVLEGRTPDASLVERAALEAASEVRPIDDVRSTARYRRHAVGVLVGRFLSTLAKERP